MTAYYNEFDPKAAAWIRELIRRGLVADGVVDERSILDVEPTDLAGFTQCHFFAGVGGWSYALHLAGWPDDRPVWTGSPPCQPFSAAGRQLGQDDARHLAPHFISLVRACRPGVLFGEQVASAAVFGKAAKRTRKEIASPPPPEWAWLDDLQDRLEAARYAVGASDIPAAGVGAAHIRQRTFFGAIRMADDDDAGPQRRLRGGSDTGREDQFGHTGRCGPAGGLADSERSDASDSPWRVADWLFCRDGKWRPVKARPQQMADGLPDGMGRGGSFLGFLGSDEEKARAVVLDEIGFPLGQVSYHRVARLRGYGNAIVPQAAAEFVQAFDAASGERLRLTEVYEITTDNIQGVFA